MLKILSINILFIISLFSMFNCLNPPNEAIDRAFNLLKKRENEKGNKIGNIILIDSTRYKPSDLFIGYIDGIKDVWCFDIAYEFKVPNDEWNIAKAQITVILGSEWTGTSESTAVDCKIRRLFYQKEKAHIASPIGLK